jgi:hypothetical protein
MQEGQEDEEEEDEEEDEEDVEEKEDVLAPIWSNAVASLSLEGKKFVVAGEKGLAGGVTQFD